jgi:type IV secretion system protein VirB10
MSNNMSPGVSPGTFGVRRANRLPLYIIGGFLALFLLVMAVEAMNRAASQKRQGEEMLENAKDTSQFARAIVGNVDGLVKAEPLTLPPEDEPLALETTGSPSLPEPRDEDAERIRQMKAQAFERAIQSKTKAPSFETRGTSGGSPASREDMLSRLASARRHADAALQDDPTAVYKAKLAQLQGQETMPSIGTSTSGSSSGGGLLQVADKSYSQFDGDGSGSDRWRLNSKLEDPRSPFELRAGFVIPAVLISGVNSDLPGQIIGQVSQNVYDTPTGNHLLIPLGSRLVGSYDANVAFGQARVMVAWQRIVFPDGRALDIGAMPGADSAGYSGFKDKVNNHYFRIFGTALLASFITAGISYSQDNYDDERGMRATMSESIGQELGQATAQLISKNINISPTLEIRPGYRFNVMVVNDLTFSRPYRPFNYQGAPKK